MTAADPFGNAQAPDARDIFAGIATATGQLVAALDDAGLHRSLRQASTATLSGLDRSLPRQTLDDLLAACEAYALVTGPSALGREDAPTLHGEAWRILATLHGIERASRKRTRTGRPFGATMSVNASLLREALGVRRVAAALGNLITSFEALQALEPEDERRRRGWLLLLPLGARFLMPGAVLAVAAAIIAVLLGGVMLSGRGADSPAPRGAHSATATGAAAKPPAAAPTATTPAHIAPAAPTATPTRMPAAPAQIVAVSPLDQPPCNGGPDARFTIAFSNGPGAVHWSATPFPDNPADTQVSLDGASYGSQVSGTLNAGQQVTVFVRSLHDLNSQINVTTSAGPFTVTVDSTGC